MDSMIDAEHRVLMPKRYSIFPADISVADLAEYRRAGGKRQLPAIRMRILFNSLSSVMGAKDYKFREKIAPTAFDSALAPDADIRCLFNHNPDSVLARTTSGTLKVQKTADSMDFIACLADTTWARDAIQSISRGDISEMSFGMKNIRDSWSQAPDGMRIRTIESADLFDVSPTGFAAYPRNTASLIGAMPDDETERSEIAEEAAMEVRRVQLNMHLEDLGMPLIPRSYTQAEQRQWLERETAKLDADRRRQLETAEQSMRQEAEESLANCRRRLQLAEAATGTGVAV
jgi:HK97 family phage prohead protease